MSANAIHHSLIPILRRHSEHCTFGIVSHNSNNSILPISRIITFDSSLNGLWTLFCCKSAWSARRWGWVSIFFTSSWRRKFSACFTTARGDPDTLKSIVYFLELCEQTDGLSTFTGLTVFVWSASTFSSASLSLSARSTDTGTQLFASVTVLKFVLSHPNKTSFPISRVSKPGACSLRSLSVLDDWVFDLGVWLNLNPFFWASLMSTQHTVFRCFFHFLLVPSKTWCFQVTYIRIFVFLVHGIHRREEYRLSFAQNLSFWYQSWIHDGV